MGVHRSPAIADYWKHDDQNPLHPIRTHMSQTRFEQSKRYLHIESPSVPKEQKDTSTCNRRPTPHLLRYSVGLSAHLVAYVLLGTSEHDNQRSDYLLRSPGYTRAEPQGISVAMCLGSHQRCGLHPFPGHPGIHNHPWGWFFSVWTCGNCGNPVAFGSDVCF
jgi:hypothetical protein